MVSVSTIICCVITLLICLLLPVLVLLLFANKCKKQGILPAWLLGAAGFFVTQILIRLPILTALQSQSWFQSLANNHLVVYGFGLAFTAGLFELAGRFVVAKILHKKQLNFHRRNYSKSSSASAQCPIQICIFIFTRINQVAIRCDNIVGKDMIYG